MNNINITVNMSQEDRLRIDTVIGLLEGLTTAAQSANLIEPKVVETVIYPHKDAHKEYWDTVGLIKEEQTSQDEPQEVENEEITEEDIRLTTNLDACEPTVTEQDILQKVIALCGKGKKAEAKGIITTYADSVSDLPDSTLNEVWDKLTALEM